MTCPSQLLSLVLSLSPSPEELSGLYLSPAWTQLLLQHVGIPVRGGSFSSLLPGCWCTVTHVVVQSLSHVWPFVTPWTTACQTSLSFTISRSLLKLMSSNHLLLCHPIFRLPSVFSNIRVFFNKSALCITWPKYWSISFSISPSSEYSGLISFRMDWFHLLADQRTLKSLLQHNTSNESILHCSTFFMVQLSHPYMTTGKTLALIRQTLLAKWCLCFLKHCLGLP